MLAFSDSMIRCPGRAGRESKCKLLVLLMWLKYFNSGAQNIFEGTKRRIYNRCEEAILSRSDRCGKKDILSLRRSSDRCARCGRGENVSLLFKS